MTPLEVIKLVTDLALEEGIEPDNAVYATTGDGFSYLVTGGYVDDDGFIVLETAADEADTGEDR